MLIMPIGNGKNVVNVKVSLKNKNLVSKSTYLQTLNESEVVIGNKKFSASIFSKDGLDFTKVMTFIRHHSLNMPNDKFTVVTREEKESKLYDVYSVSLPPKYVNTGLDELFGAAITDLRRTIPNSNKGRNISLKQFGILEDLSKKRMKEFRKIVEQENSNKYFTNFKDVIETLEFLREFDCEIIDGSVISKDMLEYMLEVQKPTNTDFYKKLKKYYKTALDNEDIYRKLVYLHRSIYGKPYNLIHKSDNNLNKFRQNTKKD